MDIKKSVITFISNYFIAPRRRDKPLNRLEDKSGVILTWGELQSYTNMCQYINWLTSMIRYSRKIDIDLTKLIKLIKSGYANGLNWYNEQEFIDIYLDSIKRDEDEGEDIGETTLSRNSLEKDKKYDK